MEKTKIRMLVSKRGSEDGFTVKHFEKDETYDVAVALADAFVGDKSAELVIEGKAEKAAPKNKAEKAADDNKSE